LPRGRLLVADYRSRSTPVDEPWLDITLQEWGYNITARKSGSYDNRELVRVYVIEKPGEK
jgi:hypothetical protein